MNLLTGEGYSSIWTLSAVFKLADVICEKFQAFADFMFDRGIRKMISQLSE